MKKIKVLAIFCALFLFGINGFSQENSIKAGEQCPDFSYSDIDSNIVSLKDFAGKFVYIDVWATWCGPCKKEIPVLKELEKKMHNKNIVFVSLSVDKNRDQWLSFVKQNSMAGIQLHNGGDRSLSDAFDIKYIPRFILIGPDGKIVNNAALRPSSGEELVTYLNEQLAKVPETK